MALPLLLLAMLGAAANPADPIFVKGHAWAPFISPMGEPFRARTIEDDTLTKWFAQADRNRDGALTPEEMAADADRFFATLDTDGDGLIGPEELIQYEWELAPDVQLSSRLRPQPGDPAPKRAQQADESDEAGRPRRSRGGADPDSLTGGLQGAARYGLLNMPEPVAAADADFDRAISRAEFEQAALARYQLLDAQHQGSLTLAALEAMWTSVLAKVHDRKHHADPVDTRVGEPVPVDR